MRLVSFVTCLIAPRSRAQQNAAARDRDEGLNAMRPERAAARNTTLARRGESRTRAGLTDRTVVAIRAALRARRRGLRTYLVFVGPAIIASVAYVDPGNFATNIQAGAKFGYELLWVVVLASLIGMLFQALSAKLGIVTGRNLAELSREQFSQPIVWGMWIVSEVAAMATDLAEFVGGAIGLSLLLHISLFAGMAVTAVITYGILLLDRRGFRLMELIIAGFVSVIGLCYLAEMFIAPIDWRAAAAGLVMPRLGGAGAVTIAVGIVGATVMPHALYLHSSLTQTRVPGRSDRERRQLLRFSNCEVLVALTIAGLVNVAIMMMASGAFHAGHSDVGEISTAYYTLAPLLGAGAAGIFLVSLLASGVSSSVVGTMAGQVIMQGFVEFQIPIAARRLITMIPSIVVVALGMNATAALVLSQVVLSFAVPIPMIALLILMRRADIMGEFVNGPVTQIAAVSATALVLFLNLVLLVNILG